MRQFVAKYASVILSVVASVFVVTSSGILWHLPEAPEELLNK